MVGSAEGSSVAGSPSGPAFVSIVGSIVGLDVSVMTAGKGDGVGSNDGGIVMKFHAG